MEALKSDEVPLWKCVFDWTSAFVAVLIFIPAHCSAAKVDAMDIPQEVASLLTCVDKSPQSPIAYDLFSSSSSLAIPLDEATKTGNASIPNKNCESNALH